MNSDSNYSANLYCTHCLRVVKSHVAATRNFHAYSNSCPECYPYFPFADFNIRKHWRDVYHD